MKRKKYTSCDLLHNSVDVVYFNNFLTNRVTND